ncbi:MAG: hypothetical protein IKU07_06630 [Oscillospiraceae bacterium]|nr:hypothetical protein [Oscillospiraceae bacterium]
MSKKIRYITETAVLLALLVALQAVTKPLGQLVTGSCVNAVLAVAALFTGLGGGLTIALISPVCAFLLGIAPNFVTVLPIMLGNAIYVTLLYVIAGREGKRFWRQPVAVAVAAGAKFALLYLLVVKVICGVASGALLGKKLGDIVVLAPPMLNMLPTTFAWPQLFTALIGGAAALLLVPVLRKALHRN